MQGLPAPPLTRVKPIAKKDAAARTGFMMILKIWGSEVVGSRGGYHKAWLSRRHERRYLCG